MTDLDMEMSLARAWLNELEARLLILDRKGAGEVLERLMVHLAVVADGLGDPP